MRNADSQYSTREGIATVSLPSESCKSKCMKCRINCDEWGVAENESEKCPGPISRVDIHTRHSFKRYSRISQLALHASKLRMSIPMPVPYVCLCGEELENWIKSVRILKLVIYLTVSRYF